MKRFFLISAFATIMASITVIFFTKFSFVLLIIIPAVLNLLTFIFKRYFARNYMLSALCFSLVFITSLMLFKGRSYKIKQVEALSGTSAVVTGTLLSDVQDENGHYEYIFKPDRGELGDVKSSFKIVLNSKFKIDATSYDRLKVGVDLTEINQSVKLIQYSSNILLNGKVRYCVVYHTENKPIYYRTKNHVASVLKENLPQDIYGIPIAILTGDKSHIENSFYTNVKLTGMAHIMAVSGMHISIICMSIVVLLQRLNSGRKAAAVVGLIVLFFLAGVAGFTGSVLRAGLMYLLMFCGELFSRRVDSLNSLGFSITVLCIINPYYIFNISLILSVLGTLGIIIFSSPILNEIKTKHKVKGIYKWVYNFVISSIIISLGASIFIIPVSLFVFGYISTLSIFVNLLVTLPIYVIVFSTIIALLLPFKFAFTFTIQTVAFSSKIFKSIIDYFAEQQMAVLYKDDLVLYFILLIIALFVLSLYLLKNHKRFIIVTAAISCLFIAFSVSTHLKINEQKQRIVLFPAESGCCVVIEHKNNTAVIIATTDQYSIYNIDYYLNSRLHKRIDLLLIANNESDVFEKALSLSENYKIANVYAHNNNADIQKYAFNNTDITLSSMGDDAAVYIKSGDDTILIDNQGTFSEKADYIITSNPMLSFKIHGNASKYILSDEYNNSVAFSGYIHKRGGEAAVLTGLDRITAVKYANNVLKFKR